MHTNINNKQLGASQMTNQKYQQKYCNQSKTISNSDITSSEKLAITITPGLQVVKENTNKDITSSKQNQQQQNRCNQ